MIGSIDWFFCCLHPIEQNAFKTYLLAYIGSGLVGVPLTVWDTYWTLIEGTPTTRRDAFRALYHLEIDTIVVGDPPVPVDVVVPSDILLWAVWAVYLLGDAATCVDGCGQSHYP